MAAQNEDNEAKQELKLNNNIDDEKSNINAETSLLEWTSRSEQVLYFLASHKASGTKRDNKLLSKSLNYCKTLFQRDGEIIVIDNYGKKEFCDSYPTQIIIQKSFIDHNSTLHNTNLSDLFKDACYARARNRFVAPVIFLPNNACIARSSTLSSSSELLLNKGNTFVINAMNYTNNTTQTKDASPMGNDVSILRAADIQLLNHLNIKYICDLMVEHKKKFGFGGYGMKIASSEKADKEQRYKAFHLNSIPYPGCELFKLFNERKHNATNLMPKWEEAKNDAILNLNDGCNNSLCNKREINWNEYKKWDIIGLTQNYLRLIMDYLQISFSGSFNVQNGCKNENVGLLIHCISGWDRTPLFVSLIRLSLWADNIIHCELSSAEVLYLTLAYDWLLFTHNFGKRLNNGEHIFQFSFYMLQWIINDKYSIFYNENNKEMNEKSKNVSKREDKLMEVYMLFNKVYTQVMEIDTPPKYAAIENGNEIGVNEITGYLKNIIPKSIIGSENNEKTNEKVLSTYEKLIGMGFDDQLAMKSAKKYPNNMEKALDYALKHQNDDVNLEDSHK